MKLLTLNTHSLIEPAYEAKRDAFVEFIRKEQPDVFALQEVNQTAAAPLLADVPAGYYPCPGNMVLLKADNHAAAVGPDAGRSGLCLPLELAPGQDRLRQIRRGHGGIQPGTHHRRREPAAEPNQRLQQLEDPPGAGICAGDVWYYAVHLGWWKDEEEPFGRPVEHSGGGSRCKTAGVPAGRFQQ